MNVVNLFDFDRKSLAEYIQSLKEPSFRSGQIIQWIHQHAEKDINNWTNLSKSLREKLIANTTMQLPKVVFDHVSTDGTRKWLMQLPEGNCVETVLIPESNRGTLCISSQVGCALNCTFCATATQGFNRNLSTAEIIGQVRLAKDKLREDNPHSHKITNVVLMGMGEPLLNYDNVLKSINLMLDDYAYGLSKYRVTLSTSGVLPNLKRLAKDSECALAVSLHAPNNQLRDQLVPINKKYPLEELIPVCRDYFPKTSKRAVTFEYVMLDGVNDQAEHAKQLVKLLQGVKCKMNLIPFNPFKATRYQCSSLETIEKFRYILTRGGLLNTVRKTRGDDIAAACGQLVGNFKDRTKRSEKMQKSYDEWKKESSDLTNR